MKSQATIKCPQCGSKRLYKDGLRYLKDGATVQRWLCRDCGYRFSDPNQKIKNEKAHNKKWQVSVRGLKPLPKNLLKALTALTETTGKTTSGHAGAAQYIKGKLDKATAKGLLLQYEFWLQKEEPLACNKHYVFGDSPKGSNVNAVACNWQVYPLQQPQPHATPQQSPVCHEKHQAT